MNKSMQKIIEENRTNRVSSYNQIQYLDNPENEEDKGSITKEFMEWKEAQLNKYNKNNKAMEKSKKFAKISAITSTIAVGSLTASGLTASPLLIVGLGVASTGAIGWGLSEYLKNKMDIKFGKEYGNAKMFLKEIADLHSSFGEHFFKKSVVDDLGVKNPRLSRALLEVSERIDLLTPKIIEDARKKSKYTVHTRRVY